MNSPSDASLINKLSPKGKAAFTHDGGVESGNPGNVNATQSPKTYALLRAGYYSKM